MAKNDITGDEIATKIVNDLYRDGFDRIFGVTCRRCGKSRLHPDGVHTCSPQMKELGNTGSSVLEDWKDDPDSV